MLKKVLALSVLAAMSLSVLTACGNRPQRPADAADISDEEISIIRVMQSEGKDEMEIAEALVLHEKTASGQKAAPAVKATIYSGFGSAVTDTASDMLEHGKYLFRKITAAPVSASSDGWVKDGGDYYFYKDGKMITGWVKDGSWYYMDPGTGIMVTGWKEVDRKWYYFSGSGAMKTGWQEIGGRWYYMASSGAMQTGWKQLGGKWYYFASSGAMQTGWQQTGGRWYYFSSKGEMQSGWQSIGGKWYYFASSGAMQTGWQQIEGIWYYFENSGAMAKGWKQTGGSWYYLSASGAMVTDWQKIDGKNYYFYQSGRMAFNTTIDGVKLGANGAAETTPSYVFRNDVEEECVRLINGLRKEHAVSLSSTFYVPLVRCDELTAKAHIRCVEITKDFSHDSASGNGLGSECIYEGGELGETASEIAYRIVNRWKGSAPHYASLMTGITAQSVNDIFYSGANCGLGVLINAKGHRYAVFGIGSMNTGRSPSTGFDGHCHHYTGYVTSYRSGNDWFDTYRCSCGKELSAKADGDPCTCHFNGEHKWSRPGFYSSYRYDSENKPCVICVRCGATGPRWKDIQQTPLDVNCDHDWEFVYYYNPNGDRIAFDQCTKCGLWRTRHEGWAVPPAQECDHDWEFEITEDIPGGYLDWFHCSKCGAWDLRFDTV